MTFKTSIKNCQIQFKSSYHEALFHRTFEGKNVKIELDEPSSTQQYKYLNGALIPYIFYQHEKVWNDIGECREALLEEFAPAKSFRRIDGSVSKIRQSSAGKNKKWLNILIEKITEWMREQQYIIPDAEEYKIWLNSSPLAHEEYPPLQKLKDKYFG